MEEREREKKAPVESIYFRKKLSTVSRFYECVYVCVLEQTIYDVDDYDDDDADYDADGAAVVVAVDNMPLRIRHSGYYYEFFRSFSFLLATLLIMKFFTLSIQA
jgi:hypothetical protein